MSEYQTLENRGTWLFLRIMSKKGEQGRSHTGEVSKASGKAAPDVGERDVLIEETNILWKYLNM